jgi:hypothetical protein
MLATHRRNQVFPAYYDRYEWYSSHNAKDLSDSVVVDLLIQSVWKQAKFKRVNIVI